MKKFITILLVLILACSFIKRSQRTLLEEFSLGNFSYSIYKEEKYIHDDNMHAEYFVVYGKDKKNSLCSSFMTAKRNDTLFTKGHYSHNQKELQFKEYYYYHQNELVLDSMIKVFYPNKNGELILKEAIKFKNGIAAKAK